MISYFEAAMQSANGLNEVIELGDTAVGLYSRVNDPDTVVYTYQAESNHWVLPLTTHYSPMGSLGVGCHCGFSVVW